MPGFIRRLLWFGLVSGLSSGCAALEGYRSIGTVVSFTNAARRIELIPVSHCAPPELYVRIAAQIRALEENQFVLLWEELDLRTDDPSAQRKLKRIFGCEARALVCQRSACTQKKGMAPQSNAALLTGNASRERRVDLDWESVIALYEKQIGPIVLTEDEQTRPLWLPSCEPTRIDEFIPTLMQTREDLLLSAIEASPSERIAILYGAGHLPSIRRRLEASGKGWVLTARREVPAAHD